MFKRKRIAVVFTVILVVVLSLAGFLRAKYVVPILMYHSVYPDAPYTHRLAVSGKTFERQMRFLKDHRYNVVPLEVVADLLRTKQKIPPRTLAITFDDGYSDNYLYAFPALKKYHLPFTVFLIADEIGRPQGDRLSWEQIKAMQDSGLAHFGSHTIGPEPLVNIKSPQEVKHQIFDSKRILEEGLKRPVTLFSYPEGMFTPEIRKLVIDAGYRAAVSTHPGLDYPGNDIFALKRLRISENCANLFVYWFEASGYYTFLKEIQRKNKAHRPHS